MPAQVHIDEFLQNPNQLFVDVRSELEFEHAHIPGAVNIPLLRNEERKAVGTLYKQAGRAAAVKLGYELAGPRFADLYDAFHAVAHQNPVFYCWRGGLRSQISASILEWGGTPQKLIKGGYKSFRTKAIQAFQNQTKLVVLSGMTGVGKTEILHLLKNKGAQILDLAGLANHKGSALGGLGQKPQPSNEMFENLLFHQWQQMDFTQVIFTENESRRIGSNVIPAALWNQLQHSKIVDIHVAFETRLQRIIKEYGHFDALELAECTERIKKRLGGLQLKLALDALAANQIEQWATILMDYYDRSYLHSRTEQKSEIDEFNWDWENPEKMCDSILNKYYKF